MNATRILPDLQSSILCEDVRQEANGNLILIGVIGVVTVPQLPISAFKLCIFNRWVAGLGQFTEKVRVLAPDQTTVLRENQARFALPDPSLPATMVTVLTQVKFETAGTYYIEVSVDDVLKLRFPVPVRVVTPPQQQQQPGQPAPTSGTK